MDPIPTQGKRKDAMMDDEGFVSTSLPKRLRQEYGSLPDSRPGQFAVMNDSGDSQRVVLEDLNTSDSLKTLVAGVDASEIILPECSSAGSTTSGNPNIDGNVQLDNSDIGIFAGEDHGPHVDDINKPSRSLIINQGLTAYRLLQLSGKAPPVWAKTRAGLCSSVPYFRQHEGGNYHTKDIPGPKNPSFTRGLLLDAGVSARDYIDGTVIITTIGGGKIRDAETGKMTRDRNQNETSINYQSLLNSKRKGYSIVVIAGDKNMKIKPPFPFCVLGEYQITDVWMEKFPDAMGNRFNQWCIRLEKMDFSEVSWFASEDDTSHTAVLGQYVCTGANCTTCNEYNKSVYEIGWTCLNSQCPRYFFFQYGIGGQLQWQEAASGQVIKYSAEFLRERTNYRDIIQRRHNLVPDLPTMNDGLQYGTEEKFKGGIVCPKCHCCSRRIFWKEWECEGDGCDFTYKPQTKPYTLTEIAKEATAMKLKDTKTLVKEVVDHWETTIAGYQTEVFTLPDENSKVCGAVVVLRATKEICGKADGPNDLFIAMQNRDVDLKLKRNVVRHPGLRIEQLCSHFSSNWGQGAFYKFGVFVETTSFADAPIEIHRGVSQLSWAQEQAVMAVKSIVVEEDTDYSADSMSLKSETFNELLSLGYFESSVINYHDDGEKELGPTVATLSLGSPAIMRYRPKKKNKIGTIGKGKKGLKFPVMSFPLYHGDICIMHGIDIHKYYDHMVEPRGKLRFAMTSRYVRPETMPSAESRAECVKKGTIPNGLEKLAYKGIDIDSISGDANLTNADTNVACVKSKKRLIVTIPISETGRAAIGNMERTAGTVQTKSQVELKPFGVITPFSFNGINDIGDFGDSTIVPPPITL